MKMTVNTPNVGGTLQVNIGTVRGGVPNTIDFVVNQDSGINVSVWLFQAIRRNVPLRYSDYDRLESEDKIGIIKAIRTHFHLGLKEAKDITEWFLENMERDVVGTL